jgi:hypothetical protein
MVKYAYRILVGMHGIDQKVVWQTFRHLEHW